MKDLIIVVAGVLIVFFSIWIGLGTMNPFYVVSSESMVPVLKVNDVLVVRDGGTFDQLKVGDIIVFHQPSGGDKVIVHRIAEISIGANGEKTLRTKGDANPGSIPGTDYPITRSDYIGRVIYVLPGLGLATHYIVPPYNYIIIAVILVILFFSRMGKKEKGPLPAAGTDGAPPSGQPPSA
jgi:signal peptidase